MAQPTAPGSLALRNPLDAFTSYSTHFVMLAARTTESIRTFIDSSPQAQRSTLDAINNAKNLGDPVKTGNTQDAFLVMDTRRFSQFTVESMKYEVLINGVAQGQAHSNLSTVIEMSILDSVGISFINFLQWLMDTKLQTNFDGMIFLIRVIFVGHNPDGSSETVQSITIPAHLYNLEVNLDFAKGVYTAQFMPDMNFSVFQHKRWLQIGTSTGFFSGVGEKKLGAMVRAFEARVNEQSEKFYTESTPRLLAAGKQAIQTTGKFGRRVVYQITLPAEWDSYDFIGSWKHNTNSSEERDFVRELQRLDASRTPAQQQQAKATDGGANPAKDVNMSVGAGTLITDVLDVIFKQVPEIAQLANGDKVTDPNGVAKFYKHVVSLTSNDEVVIVHVDVVLFAVPNAQPPQITNERQAEVAATSAREAEEKNSPYTTTTRNGLRLRVPKNYFELDYIFTGKNTQVLNFDMKIQQLQFLLAANTKVSEGQMIQDVALSSSDEERQSRLPPPEILSLRPYDPMLIPMLTDLQKKNFSVTSGLSRDADATLKANTSMQEYARNLSAFYAISPIQAAVTIKGNPDIMLKFSSPDMPAHTLFSTAVATGNSAANETERANYRNDFNSRVITLNKGALSAQENGTFTLNKQLGGDSYMSAPVFVKLNIKGPNVDFRDNKLIEGQDFASEVLLDNYYVVFKVVNIIERGVFTQQLELWSHNVFGVNKISPDTGKQPAQEIK